MAEKESHINFFKNTKITFGRSPLNSHRESIYELVYFQNYKFDILNQARYQLFFRSKEKTHTFELGLMESGVIQAKRIPK